MLRGFVHVYRTFRCCVMISLEILFQINRTSIGLIRQCMVISERKTLENLRAGDYYVCRSYQEKANPAERLEEDLRSAPLSVVIL